MLQTLIIRDERVSGTLPAGYPAALPRLQVLSLSGLLLGGSLPGAWAGWSSLRQLALYSNQVHVTVYQCCSCTALLEAVAARAAERLGRPGLAAPARALLQPRARRMSACLVL